MESYPLNYQRQQPLSLILSLIRSPCLPSFHSPLDYPQHGSEAFVYKGTMAESRSKVFSQQIWMFFIHQRTPYETLCSVTLDFHESYFSLMPGFVAVGENDNGHFLVQWAVYFCLLSFFPAQGKFFFFFFFRINYNSRTFLNWVISDFFRFISNPKYKNEFILLSLCFANNQHVVQSNY